MTRNLVYPALWLKPDPYFGNIHKIMEQVSKREYRKFVKLSEETVLAINKIFHRIVIKDLSRGLGIKPRWKGVKENPKLPNSKSPSRISI